MGNRLADETSPYLLQHRDNPVDWHAWGEPALATARGEGRPILLSVGYAACHWCHVMAHESFEDAETAALMNDLFVATEARGGGVADALIAACEERSRADGAVELEWVTAVDNTPAQRVYDRTAAVRREWVHYELDLAE